MRAGNARISATATPPRAYAPCGCTKSFCRSTSSNAVSGPSTHNRHFAGARRCLNDPGLRTARTVPYSRHCAPLGEAIQGRHARSSPLDCSAALAMTTRSVQSLRLGVDCMIRLVFLALAGLKFGKLTVTLGSMLLSIGIYATIWGWPFAVGFVLLLFVHEMGHVIAARIRGIPRQRPGLHPVHGGPHYHARPARRRRGRGLHRLWRPVPRHPRLLCRLFLGAVRRQHPGPRHRLFRLLSSTCSTFCPSRRLMAAASPPCSAPASGCWVPRCWSPRSCINQAPCCC